MNTIPGFDADGNYMEFDMNTLPDVTLTSRGEPAAKQMATIPNIAKLMEFYNIQARFDVTAAETVLIYPGARRTPSEQIILEGMVLDMAARIGIHAREQVREAIRLVALHDQFNPMEEWLKGLPPYQGDPMGSVIDAVKTDNPLWPVYLENWAVQVVEGVCGWRDRQKKVSLPHVLVLVGGQGIGKSRFFKNLGGQWFKGEAELHLGSSSSKDHQLAALKYPMVELSELDGIFRKNDVENLKAFISREEDEIRAPYERRALVRPRMTSFCGSVNNAEFLNDDTGSRRYWPVQVDSIDWAPIDMTGFWAQAYEMWQENPDFNLTPEEDAQRDHEAIKTHSLITELQEVLSDYHSRHVDSDKFEEAPMNRSEILKMLFGNRPFGNKDISLAGKVLTDIAGKHRTIDGKQRAWMFPYNKFATDRSTWPDIISLKSV